MYEYSEFLKKSGAVVGADAAKPDESATVEVDLKNDTYIEVGVSGQVNQLGPLATKAGF
jgi:hypothetical protein